MLIKIENFLYRLYKFSGILAAIFLILVAVFILIGISSRIFDFYIRGLSEYSGYCMAASTFFALAYTFSEGGHIRITLFLEKMGSRLKRIFELWCLSISSIFSGFLFNKQTITELSMQRKRQNARRRNHKGRGLASIRKHAFRPRYNHVNRDS